MRDLPNYRSIIGQVCREVRVRSENEKIYRLVFIFDTASLKISGEFPSCAILHRVSRDPHELVDCTVTGFSASEKDDIATVVLNTTNGDFCFSWVVFSHKLFDVDTSPIILIHGS